MWLQVLLAVSISPPEPLHGKPGLPWSLVAPSQEQRPQEDLEELHLLFMS